MEDANAASEVGDFLYYAEAVKVNTTLFDHTNAGGTFYSTRLNGSSNERTGLARSISVMPGDTVKTEVYAKYLDTNSGNWTTALNNLITSIANSTAPPGTFIDGGAAGSTGGATAPWLGLLNKGNETGTAPKAYLNYLIFDRDYNFVNGGFVRMTEAAREYGQDGAHEKLAAEFVITQAGYVYIYLSNDNAALGGSQIETYWDDFKVIQVKSPIVQMEDFYPFGWSFNSYRREHSLENKFLYNGKEIQRDLDLSVYDYGRRMYDPALGRWWQLDPLSELGRRWSPYSYAFDNPMRFIDPDGMWPDLPSWNDVKDFANGVVNAIASNNTNVTSVDGQTTLVQGIARGQGGSAYTMGQKIGDAVSLAQGIIEFGVGATVATGGTVGGIVTSPTGVGAVAGAAVATGGVVVAAHGANTAKNALTNMLAKPGSGKGSVPANQRDPKRTYTKKEKQEMLDDQGGNCANCGEPATVDEVDGHHVQRHADGGQTTKENGASVCKDCHKDLHKPEEKKQ